MDNNKKLSEGLLKADGIDPAGATESERIAFGTMLDEQSKLRQSMPRTAWPNIWRIIMKSRITKLAAAASFVNLCFIIILHISGQAMLGFDCLSFDCSSSIIPKAMRSDSVAPVGSMPSAFSNPSDNFLLLSILPFHFFTQRLLCVKYS